MTTRVTTATAWTSRSHADYDALPGQAVYSADGEPLGTIAGVLHPNREAPGVHGPHYVALGPGEGQQALDGEVYLHETAIREVRADGVWLDVGRDDLTKK